MKPKILLAAINACYNHTNIAVRSIALFSQRPGCVTFCEWTINQSEGEILRGIAGYEPDILIFSVYIWNADMVRKLIPDIKKILPGLIIVAGGPEAGYCAEKYLDEIRQLDFIIHGEGEVTSKELTDTYCTLRESPGFDKSDLSFLGGIKGLFIRNPETGKAVFTGECKPIENLAQLPFPYPEITDPDNRIYYYESSRGCPFSCAYCMSSLDGNVRFMPLERVFSDIQRFLDARVRLVKFIDRTYNLNEDRYIAIWSYILSHHNNKTMFHFEIEAEYLSVKALEFLKTVPSGIMQFEIGIQSSNKRTLEAVKRSGNTERLAENISSLPKTIHCHLDLIAGLPYEDLKSFGKSFEFAMKLKPDALQLGFLKVLHGTQMEKYCKENGWQWTDSPPYETLMTPFLSYKDMTLLKDIETLTDAYWNKGSFLRTMQYTGRAAGFWNFFRCMAEYAGQRNAFSAPKKESFWFSLLAEIFQEQPAFLGKGFDCVCAAELLRFDFISSGKKGGFPEWYTHNYDKTSHRAALELNGGVKNSRLDFAYSDYDVFSVNPFSRNPENTKGRFEVLFIYARPESDSKNSQILINNKQRNEL